MTPLAKHLTSPKRNRLFWVVALVLVLCLRWIPSTCSMPSDTVSGILHQSWDFYKARFMDNGERVVSNNFGGTITEGQSYALMKALWMDDPQTFSRVWTWTQTHMKRPQDHLFGWRWGTLKNGASGLIETENASDADQDIAYALLLAGEKWHQPQYTAAAKAIIADLWRQNVSDINGRYYLNPGTWEGFRQADALTVDPSYFAPYVYRKFAQVDPTHPWTRLADNIYPTLEACSNLTANRLPPNWCSVNWKDNHIGFSDVQGENARHFSYDAYRVFWRMAMDAAQGSPQAQTYLNRHTALQTAWDQTHSLPEIYLPTGQPAGPRPSGFTQSAALAQRNRLTATPPDTLYRLMLHPYYHPEGYWFNDYNDYLHSVIWLHLYTLTLSKSSEPGRGPGEGTAPGSQKSL